MQGSLLIRYFLMSVYMCANGRQTKQKTQHTNTHADRQTHRQTDTLTHVHTHTHTYTHTHEQLPQKQRRELILKPENTLLWRIFVSS